jgi:hypothetical protein
MNTPPTAVLRHLRALMPDRPLEEHEARSVAERQSLRLLQILGQNSPSVDVAAIAELPRIEVRVAPKLPISGFSQWTGGRWLIGVNRDDAPQRRRFTLVHEFKHVLDHPFIDRVYADRKGKTDSVFVEQICDFFAACTLMPRPWLKQAWVRGIQDQATLADLFKVSEAAMAIRLRQVGLVGERSLGWKPLGIGNEEGGSVTRYFRRDPRLGFNRPAVRVDAPLLAGAV